MAPAHKISRQRHGAEDHFRTHGSSLAGRSRKITRQLRANRKHDYRREPCAQTYGQIRQEAGRERVENMVETRQNPAAKSQNIVLAAFAQACRSVAGVMATLDGVPQDVASLRNADKEQSIRCSRGVFCAEMAHRKRARRSQETA
jgi:hypothetical protein